VIAPAHGHDIAQPGPPPGLAAISLRKARSAGRGLSFMGLVVSQDEVLAQKDQANAAFRLPGSGLGKRPIVPLEFFSHYFYPVIPGYTRTGLPTNRTNKHTFAAPGGAGVTSWRIGATVTGNGLLRPKVTG